MAPFDRPCTTFYWSAIVNIALSSTVLSYLMLNNIVTLKYGLEVTQVIQNGTIRKLGCSFLFISTVTMALSCISSEIQPDIGRKSWFFIPLVFGAPVRGPCRNIDIEKREWWKNFEDMCNRLHTIPACDGWRYAYASGGKNRLSWKCMTDDIYDKKLQKLLDPVGSRMMHCVACKRVFITFTSVYHVHKCLSRSQVFITFTSVYHVHKCLSRSQVF